MAKEKVFILPNDIPHNQTELAESYGITKQTMNNYMRMASMIPELEDLVETNIRQRGIGNPNPVKLGRCIKELERIYGIEHGGNHGNQYKEANPKLSELPTQEQLADMIGISVDTLQNYKLLAEMIPES